MVATIFDDLPTCGPNISCGCHTNPAMRNILRCRSNRITQARRNAVEFSGSRVCGHALAVSKSLRRTTTASTDNRCVRHRRAYSLRCPSHRTRHCRLLGCAHRILRMLGRPDPVDRRARNLRALQRLPGPRHRTDHAHRAHRQVQRRRLHVAARVDRHAQAHRVDDEEPDVQRAVAVRVYVAQRIVVGVGVTVQPMKSAGSGIAGSIDMNRPMELS